MRRVSWKGIFPIPSFSRKNCYSRTWQDLGKGFCWEKSLGSPRLCILTHIHIYFPSSRWILDFKQLYTVAKNQESSIIFCPVAKHISSCWQKQQLVRLSLRTGIEVVGRGDMTFLENEFYQLLPKVEIHCTVELFIFYISEPSFTGWTQEGVKRVVSLWSVKLENPLLPTH